jgi:methylenetetrahydrofolate reductase (NADPH)
MKFDDEPLVPGHPLPIRPGHYSPGRLERVLRAGAFAVTAEIAPPDSADPNEVYERASLFDGYVDAINATDGSGANCHMSSVGMCALLTRRGYAMVLQVSARDRNRIAIQGDVLGAAAMGVYNILCLTGDGVDVGDHPEAKPVFDVDCMSMLGMVRGMRDDGQFLSGRKLTSPPNVFLGAAANPFAPPLDYRPLRLAKKVAAGAQFVQTQYCFDMDLFRNYMAAVRDAGTHEKVFILAGVGPLASARSAEWIRSNVPGIHIPDAVIQRLKGADNEKEEGVRICVEMINELREIEGVDGVHIMAFRQEHRVGEIVERSGVLDGREPWRPKHDWEELAPSDDEVTLVSSASKEVRIGFDRPFVIIGERINPTGRKILAEEMSKGDYSRVEADAIAQVQAGAHMLDVNAGIPLADEPAILADESWRRWSPACRCTRARHWSTP